MVGYDHDGPGIPHRHSRDRVPHGGATLDTIECSSPSLRLVGSCDLQDDVPPAFEDGVVRTVASPTSRLPPGSVAAGTVP